MGNRPDISMTPAEITAFLATQRRVVVAALDRGAPVGTVASARMAGSGIEVSLPPDDEVAALLAADDRVCVIAEQFPSYYEIRGVVAHGHAHFSREDPSTFRLALDDVLSFDFAKLPREGPGSGRAT